MDPTLVIRPATAAEADPVRRLVRAQPRMNPTGLDWRNFVVAVRPDRRVVGCVQLRPAGKGAVELGSLVVDAAERGKGLAARLVTAVLTRTEARVLVVTAAGRAHHYAPWGFRRIRPWAAPGPVRLNYLVGQAASGLRLLQGVRPRRMAVLERPAASRGGG
jgi:N-acetylglutamate synthase-like GNAT family acetyltransferase